jgi:hypothetical protein
MNRETELKIIRYRQAWMETPFSVVFPSSIQPSTFKYSFVLIIYLFCLFVCQFLFNFWRRWAVKKFIVNEFI